jgi:GT2 family glycosyltransferase
LLVPTPTTTGSSPTRQLNLTDFFAPKANPIKRVTSASTASRGIGGYFSRACLEQDMSCVTACCLAIRRDVFLAQGGFDERFAIAFNDVGSCIRLRVAGWRIIRARGPEYIA